MKTLAKEMLEGLLRDISRKALVYCPQRNERGDLLLLPLGEGTTDGCIGKTPISAKICVFPQIEDVVMFAGDGISKVTDGRETVVFGVRPCDMRGIVFMDRFMSRDNLVDPHYFARREAMTCMVVACNEPPSETCFCTATGKRPFLTATHYDVQFFDAGDYFIALAGSKKGNRILEDRHFKAAAEKDIEKVKRIKENSSAAGMAAGELEDAIKKLAEDRVDGLFWEKLALRCIKCGGCAYVCPTCTCYNVQDYHFEFGYRRCRSWDSCLFSGFTRETSGHNPRATQGARLARRYEHKLKYDLMKYHEIGCVGCGRCSDVCPVGLGAIEIVREIALMP